MTNKKNSLVSLIGVIASCLAIYTFVTGYTSIPETIGDFMAPDTTGESPNINIRDLLVSPTPKPAIDPTILPSTFFPENNDINSPWKEVNNELLTNEEWSKKFDDPVSLFLLFKSWGRITGQRITYEYKTACDYTNYFSFHVSVYNTELGASQATDWLSNYYKNYKESDTQEISTEVTNSAYVTWFNSTNNCQDELRQASILFYKYNVVTNVLVSEDKIYANDDKILEDIIYFSKLIELKIESNAYK